MSLVWTRLSRLNFYCAVMSAAFFASSMDASAAAEFATATAKEVLLAETEQEQRVQASFLGDNGCDF